jgi:hypothetical protein
MNKKPIKGLYELAEMAEKHEVTHKEIFDRLVKVEHKVDKIEANTEGLVAAFQAAQGAFTVLEWIAKVVKPLLWVVASATALIAAWDHFRAK